MKKAEEDAEGESGGEDGKAAKRQERMRGGYECPGLVDDEAQGDERRSTCEHRARGRHHRIHMPEVAPEDRGTGIADGGEDDGELGQELAPEPVQRLDP